MFGVCHGDQRFKKEGGLFLLPFDRYFLWFYFVTKFIKTKFRHFHWIIIFVLIFGWGCSYPWGRWIEGWLLLLYNLYYDYWDLINMFWPVSTKWNTPFNFDYLYWHDNNKGQIILIYFFKNRGVNYIYGRIPLSESHYCNCASCWRRPLLGHAW